MEEDLTFLGKWKMTSIFLKVEDDLNSFENVRRPHFFRKWKTTLIFLKMEDDLNFFENGRQPQFFLNGRRSQFF